MRQPAGVDGRPQVGRPTQPGPDHADPDQSVTAGGRQGNGETGDHTDPHQHAVGVVEASAG